jgi:hypothetical protein
MGSTFKIWNVMASTFNLLDVCMLIRDFKDIQEDALESLTVRFHHHN